MHLEARVAGGAVIVAVALALGACGGTEASVGGDDGGGDAAHVGDDSGGGADASRGDASGGDSGGGDDGGMVDGGAGDSAPDSGHDAGRDAASDASTHDAGAIACGNASCDGTKQYCQIGHGGVQLPDGGNNTSYTCLPLPMACVSNPTCACLQQHGGGGCMCKDVAGGLQVECFFP
jgi:hypothetical protein